MSVLELPRLHFAGSCLLHEPTGNRNSQGNIDFSRNQLFRDGERITPEEDVSAFYENYRKLGQRYGSTGLADPEGAFSAAAGRDYEGNSRVLWNAVVTACQTQFGVYDADPLIGRKVDLWGHYNDFLSTTFNQPKVVELDSTSMWTRQIYGGQLAIGRLESSVKTRYLCNGYLSDVQGARLHKAAHYCDLPEHWNNDEIGRAELFQSVVETQQLIAWHNDVQSPCLDAFRRALDADPQVGGLVLQYILFNASSPVTPNTPLFCSLVGTVGLWRPDFEMRSYPAGRVLQPEANANDALHAARGTVVLQPSDAGITLNLLLGVPFAERSSQPLAGPLHAPGRPNLCADLYVLERGSQEPLAQISADRVTAADFLRQGGIIDVPYLGDGGARSARACHAPVDLVLAERTSSGDYRALYSERPVVVESDLGVLYMDVQSPDVDPRFDAEIQIRSFVRGKPARVPEIELVVVANPGFLPLQQRAAVDHAASPLGFKLQSSSAEFSERLTFGTDAQGRCMLQLRARTSASVRIVFVTSAKDRALLASAAHHDAMTRYDSEDRLGLWGRVGACYVRILPDDWQLASLTDETTDYSVLYEHVLQFYELLYPFMNREVFSLADGARCRAHALLNWYACDPSNRDKSYYMPPTRELSYPKAMLFKRFVMNSASVGYVPHAAPKKVNHDR